MLTMIDCFAGAGGSATGAVSVPGVTLTAAANHWPLAMESHAANHPGAEHICADISQYDPRRFPHSDMGWFSPECTWHTGARGKRYDGDAAQPDLFGETLPDEAAERSRATMWDVVRFTEVHRYRLVFVENVVEIMKWPPVHGWFAAMESLGYRWKVVSLNSMHAQAHGLPAPQSRDRVYVVFWRAGNKAPEFQTILRPQAWCPSCEHVVESIQTWKNGRTVGKYNAQYYYRCPNHACRGQRVEPGWLPASSIIDWSIPGTRIGDRARPLKPKTLARIKAGIDRYWGALVAEAAGNTLLIPVEGRASTETAKQAADPLRAMTTRNETGLTMPPFIAEMYGKGGARSTLNPLSTVTAGGSHHALITSYYGSGDTRTIEDPLGTVTTLDRHALITPAGSAWNIDDCYFRMLEPSESKRGMAFPADYKLLGTRREQQRQAGNAVTPPSARDVVWCGVDSLGDAA